MKSTKTTLLRAVRQYLVNLPRSSKQLVSVSADAVGFSLCALLATWLLFGLDRPLAGNAAICLLSAAIGIPLAWGQGLYQSIVRYIGLDLFVAGGKTALGAASGASLLLYATGMLAAPVRWGIVFCALSLIYICASRFLGRIFLVRRKSRHERESVIIYGAGEAAASLATGLFGNSDFLPVAMIDDDVQLYGKTVQGLVVHPPSTLGKLIRQTDASRVLLAIPSASRRKRREILERLSEYPVHVQTMPDLGDLVSGKARVDDISDVDVEDLLGRDPVPPYDELLRASVTGKSVMVTGAGGSIGSELCRQIIELDPKTLILFELSEIALYNIEREISERVSRRNSRCEVVPLLGSVRHEQRVTEILRSFSVNTVYHAAAYKHVPVVEHNLLEGVQNNVVGTLRTAKAAAASGVETFVLISTDKAVSPTSVMGATKRFAELVLQALNDRHDHTRFCMVRFGNVLESSGSVVPLFRQQIRNGGPVTVTHPEIIRYFMTIPEAAQLVIQAGGMANGGDVFVLNMGEPVKIRDLAVRMINLMGLTVKDADSPHGDIEIEYTGLRPAEKLYEELLIGSNVSGTRHPRIMRAEEEYLPYEQLKYLVDELVDASRDLNREQARSVLLRSVHGYRPQNGIEDLVWVQRTGTTGTTKTRMSDTVVDFKPRSA